MNRQQIDTDNFPPSQGENTGSRRQAWIWYLRGKADLLKDQILQCDVRVRRGSEYRKQLRLETERKELLEKINELCDG
jgi:hypothetical protein